MIKLILILCLIPSFAFAKTSILKLRDGSSYCGTFYKKNAAYCKSVAGGEVCWNKKDVVSLKKVKDCDKFIENSPSNTELRRSLRSR